MKIEIEMTRKEAILFREYIERAMSRTQDRQEFALLGKTATATLQALFDESQVDREEIKRDMQEFTEERTSKV